MKIGILCEGEFSDKPVLEVLLKDQFPGVDFLIRGVDKRVIFSAADAELAIMFNKFNVERALILWDLIPLAGQGGVKSQQSTKANRREQRRMLLELLCNSTYLPQHLYNQALTLSQRYNFRSSQEAIVQNPGQEDLFTLVCVCYELDSWLLSDHDILCELASTESRRMKRLRSNPGEPDKCQNPTAALITIFSEAYSKRFRHYNKHTHNALIAKEYVKQNKVNTIRKSSESFRRVVNSIERWIQK